MKRNIALIGTLALLLVSACDSSLERYPLDSPSADTFFSNETEIQGGVNGCYGYINASGSTSNGSNGYLSYEYSWDALADVMFIRGGGFAQENLLNSQDYKLGTFRNFWLTMYQGVARCNLLLQKIEEHKEKLSEAKIKQFKGEIYFCRGLYYTRLTNMFGDVVYTDKPITSVEEAKKVTRTAKVEVVKKIYEDFDQSAQYLKGSTEKTLGRATWGAALSYKARAALQNNDWAIAAAAAKEVIDSKLYKLMPKYETLFTKASVESATNTEQILSQGHLVLANNATSYFLHAGSRGMGGYSTIVPTQNMVDSYQCTDGKEISTSPLYNKLSPYENRDPRMRFSLVLPGDLWDGRIFETRKDKPTLPDGTKNPDSYASTEFTSFTGYLLRKYVNFAYRNNSSQDETTFMLMRYAEVLLTYAEAKIELNQIDADCLAALNQVRNGRDDVKMPVVNAGITQANARKLVRYERKVELFNEGLRYIDLIRWNRASTVLTRPIFGRPIEGDYDKYPSVSFDEMGDPVYDYTTYKPHPSTDYRILILCNWDKRQAVWPIPEQEYSLNPGLGQNTGW